MPCYLKRIVRPILLLIGLVTSPLAGAAPGAVLPFGMETWAQLRHQPARQTLVVFTTTACQYCPAVIDKLAQQIKAQKSRARLLVVVMDGEDSGDALRNDAHYRQADAFYTFSGNDMALRSTVNSQWRGITPYVALLPREGETTFTLGAPDTATLRRFIKQ